MAFDDETLKAVFARTSGDCHICGKRLAFRNYGSLGARGAWEVEHSVPKANGGTDRVNNLYAAHISCNRSKGAGSTRTARARHGRTRAPLSAAKREEVTVRNALLGAGGGAALGARIAGPAGAVVGGLIGLVLGAEKDPDPA